MRDTVNLFLPITRGFRFFLVDVVPVAASEIYYWARDWQVLLLGVFALFLAWRWSLTVERRAEKTAKEILSRALRLRMSPDHGGDDFVNAASYTAKSPDEMDVFQTSVSAVRGDFPEHGVDFLKQDLQIFRKDVRNILSMTPVSDEPLTAKIEAGCRKLASTSFLRFRLVPDLEGQVADLLAQLEEGVRGMEATDTATCRELWQRLVELNATARSIEEAILSGGSNVQASK